MKNSVQKIDKYHQTKQGKLLFGIVEILIAYVVISVAIDSGSLWQYAIGALLIIGGINNLIRVFSSNNKHGKPKLKKR